MATVWGVCFSALQTTILLVMRVTGRFPADLFGPRIVGLAAIRGFLAGAAAGTLFALALTAAERRRTLSGLSRGRVALWGFLGAAVSPVALVALLNPDLLGRIPVGAMVTGTLLTGVVGMAISTTIVRVARRAPKQALDSAEYEQMSQIGAAESK